MLGVSQFHPAGSAGMELSAALVEGHASQVELLSFALPCAGAFWAAVGAGPAGAAVSGPRLSRTAAITAVAMMMDATMMAMGSHRRAGLAGG
ncbi:hypothetical protein A5739_24710 [Mycobacterium colombiense]|nr:hypothetical protein A5739_24710 [Mycobacterium colombiense]